MICPSTSSALGSYGQGFAWKITNLDKVRNKMTYMCTLYCVLQKNLISVTVQAKTQKMTHQTQIKVS